MVFLIVVLIYYLAHAFWKFIVIIIRIVVVVIESTLDQVYTYGLDTGYYITQLLVAMIALGFLKVQTKKPNTCFW